MNEVNDNVLTFSSSTRNFKGKFNVSDFQFTEPDKFFEDVEELVSRKINIRYGGLFAIVGNEIIGISNRMSGDDFSKVFNIENERVKDLLLSDIDSHHRTFVKSVYQLLN